MNVLNKITGTANSVRNAFLIAGGMLLLLFGVSRVPHFGNNASANATHPGTGMDVGVAHAEAGDSGGSGGDSGGSGGSGGDSGGSGGGSSSGG